MSLQENNGQNSFIINESRQDGFAQGVVAVRVVAGRQEAVHVTDDGDGASLSGDAHGWFVVHEVVPQFSSATDRIILVSPEFRSKWSSPTWVVRRNDARKSPGMVSR